MAKAQISLNHSGIGSLLKSSEIRAELTRRADAIAARARDLAPVDTGAYRSSIHVEQQTSDRARVLVVADDWKSAIIEAAIRPLGRAMDAGRI